MCYSSLDSTHVQNFSLTDKLTSFTKGQCCPYKGLKLALLPSSQKQLRAKKNTNIPEFSILSLLDHGSKSEKHFWDFEVLRKCGLLLWLVHAQHDVCESKCERISGGMYLPFHFESESENKSPDFICTHSCADSEDMFVVNCAE